MIGEQPYKFVIYKSVIQSPEVFPVNNIELKSVVNSTPSFLDNNKVLPLKVLTVTNVSYDVAPVIMDSTDLYLTSPVLLSLPSIWVKVSSCVTALNVNLFNNINSSCTVIGEHP